MAEQHADGGNRDDIGDAQVLTLMHWFNGNMVDYEEVKEAVNDGE